MKNRELTPRQQDNVRIFNETIKTIKNSEKLSELQDRSIRCQHVILETDREIPHFPKFHKQAKTEVVDQGSFDVARKFPSGTTCVLNFASATNPGGGVETGASAQEECLCRCSTLYGCLSDKTMINQFYEPHRKYGSPLHNDDIIYTPGVVVFRSDDYSMLNDCQSWRLVDVISCAAPNLRKNLSNWRYNTERGRAADISNAKLLALHEQRARRILSAAATLTFDEHIVLGAFGCGAFKNDPRIVAQAYKNVLPEFLDCFKTIVFAVKCGKDKTNYTVFKEIINPQPGDTNEHR